MRGEIRVAKPADSRQRKAPGHPIAPPSGIVRVARLVLYDKIGPGPHKCHWCGREINWNPRTGKPTPGDLVVDHLNWDRSDDSPKNLVQSCSTCNAHRLRTGESKLIQDDELSVMWGGWKTRAVRMFCNRCGTAFLTIPAELRKGHGRYCSRSCARKVPKKKRHA